MSKTETKTKPEVTEEVKSEGGDMKIKSKPKMKQFKSNNEPVKVDLTKDPNVKTEEIIKVDLTKKQEDDAIQIGETKTVDVEERTGDGEKVDARGDTTIEESSSPIEEIQEIAGESVQNKVIDEVSDPTSKLPENIEKLVNFMDETGGTVEDYVRLNADYSNINEEKLLEEYYKKTKPHLTEDEVAFVMEEQFSFDTDIDEERDVKRKKLAKKEAVVEAKNFLEDLKTKYYDEIKLRPGVTQDQQFKGFDFEVGEKKFRYGVKDPNAVAENQSNLNNFVEKFLDKEGYVKDTRGYHKAMYAAQNIDKIVNHFYEQGKSDGIKTVVEGSKNPGTDVRQTAGDINLGGFKVRAIDGVDSSKLKIKRSKFNN